MKNIYLNDTLEMNNNKDLNIILIFFGFLLALASSLIVVDFNPFQTEIVQTHKVIGNVVEKKNSVTYKIKNSFYWGEIIDEIYEDSIIITGENSQAKLMIDGNIISVHENSMVEVIKNEESAIHLNIIDGFINLKKKNNMIKTIESGNKKIRLSEGNGQYNFIKKTTAETDIKVVSGELEVRNKNNEFLYNIKSDLGDKEQKINFKEELIAKLELNYPNLNENILLPEGEAINLVWYDNFDINKKLTIATDSDFKNIVLSQSLGEANYNFSPIAEGSYFWRVEVDKTLKTSRFNVKFNKKSDKIKVELNQERNIASINYDNTMHKEEIYLEIAENSTFNDTKRIRILNSGNIDLQKIGENYYRVVNEKNKILKEAKKVTIFPTKTDISIKGTNSEKVTLAWNDSLKELKSKYHYLIQVENKVSGKKYEYHSMLPEISIDREIHGNNNIRIFASNINEKHHISNDKIINIEKKKLPTIVLPSIVEF